MWKTKLTLETHMVNIFGFLLAFLSKERKIKKEGTDTLNPHKFTLQHICTEPENHRIRP